MSQKATRKGGVGDDKDNKRPTESPVKDMKKKMAANAEKEKTGAEKPTDKAQEKPVEKTNDKPADKSNADKGEKTNEKADKDKKTEKVAEKKSDGPSEKKREENGKAESSAKPDKSEAQKKPVAKQNGSKAEHTNGENGTVSGSSSGDELVIDDGDEIYPELTYDDGSDVEWEPDAPSRSLTRRSQVKATRTPETPAPRPASDKTDQDESKVLKLAQDPSTDRKLRSADSPKPESKKESPKGDSKKNQDSSKVEGTPQEKKETKDGAGEDKKGDKSDKVEVEVVVEIENGTDPSEESRKPDTNFSKSRVKVSPYRRSMRLADQTTSSVAANYTGNNTTMEMDITEISSYIDDPSMNDSSYLSGLRNIRGRRSYKLLKDMPIQINRSVRSNISTSTIMSENPLRPTGTVVGRKRKPDSEPVEVATEADELPSAGKRQRLLDRLARPFRRTAVLARNAEIVGINTDLPLTAPVASTSESFDPESLKPAEVPAPVIAAASPAIEENKRCVVM